jgi:hypothetical protein
MSELVVGERLAEKLEHLAKLYDVGVDERWHAWKGDLPLSSDFARHLLLHGDAHGRRIGFRRLAALRFTLRFHGGAA